MNLEEYRTLFMVATLGLALVAASPALSVVVRFQGSSERFSKLWLLGPGHMVEDYPFNVTVGETYSVFVRVDNHMGCSEYYVVYVKFRNSTQSLPDVSGSLPSSLPPLYEFRFFVADGKAWESPVTFAFQDVSFQDYSVFVGGVSINGVTFPVNASAVWDSENTGFNFQLFFELWRYDKTLQSFQFHNRFVGLLLNITV
jgi:uncharacterized membrane protein